MRGMNDAWGAGILMGACGAVGAPLAAMTNREAPQPPHRLKPLIKAGGRVREAFVEQPQQRWRLVNHTLLHVIRGCSVRDVGPSRQFGDDPEV